jgi:hypothetical protein
MYTKNTLEISLLLAELMKKKTFVGSEIPRVQCTSHNAVITFYKLNTNLWLCSPCGPWPLFQFLNLYTVGRIPWTEDQPVGRSLPTYRTTQTQNKRTQTSMPQVGFK